MGKVSEIEKVKLGLLKDNGSNVWLPVEMSIFVALDSKSCDSYLGSVDQPKENIKKVVCEAAVNKEHAQYVSVTVLVGIWLFVDELEVWGRYIELGPMALDNALSSIDFGTILASTKTYINKELFMKTPGEIMKVSGERAGGASHILLAYEQSNSGRWSRSDAFSYVAYVNESFTPNDWFFDTFLFLGLTADSGRNFGASSYVDKNDWLWWLDRVFAKDYCFDAFDQTVERIGELLGDKEHKLKVITMIPYPREDRDHPFDNARPGFLHLHICR